MARTNRTRRPLLRGRRVGTCYPATADAPVGSRRPGHGVWELLPDARRQFRGCRAIPLGSYRGGERYADPDEINDDQQGEEQAHSVFSLGWSALTPWNNNCSLYLPSRLLTKTIKRKMAKAMASRDPRRIAGANECTKAGISIWTSNCRGFGSPIIRHRPS